MRNWTQRPTWHKWLAAVTVGLVMLCCIGAIVAAFANNPAADDPPTFVATPPGTAAPVAAPKTTATKPAPVPKPAVTIDDGFQVVIGEDVPAGTYEAHSTSTGCYWEIDRHGTSDIVDNDLGKLGHLVVRLKVGQDFSSSDCGTWTKR